MTAVTFKVVFGRQRDDQVSPRSPRPTAPTTLTLAAQTRPDAPVTRTARLLALAYKVRRLVATGALPDQTEAAVRLGLSVPHLSHIVSLAYLAPRIQDRILAGELVISEHELRSTCRKASWSEQQASLDGLT